MMQGTHRNQVPKMLEGYLWISKIPALSQLPGSPSTLSELVPPSAPTTPSYLHRRTFSGPPLLHGLRCPYSGPVPWLLLHPLVPQCSTLQPECGVHIMSVSGSASPPSGRTVPSTHMPTSLACFSLSTCHNLSLLICLFGCFSHWPTSSVRTGYLSSYHAGPSV